MDFYTANHIDEKKADLIAHNYGIKRELLHDLQKGERLSVFAEKQKEKTAN